MQIVGGGNFIHHPKIFTLDFTNAGVFLTVVPESELYLRENRVSF